MTRTRRSPRVLYFAVRYDFYPRNKRIRSYLEDVYGAEITIVPAFVHGNAVSRYLRQFVAAVRAGRGYDLVILAEFNLHYFVFSWLAARLSRAPHLVDFFVGKYESAVEDRRSYAPTSLRAKILRAVDRLAIMSASRCVTDTDVRAAQFSSLGGGRRKFDVLPVGAPKWAYPRPAELSSDGVTRLLYYGNYIPLHGLDELVNSLEHVQSDIAITFIGNGTRRPGVEKAVREKGWAGRVVFHDHVHESALAGIIASHDVVLGVFGESPKAAGVIANKVWQSLYMGKTVLTRSSGALAEISSICDNRLVQVTDTSPKNLAASIDRAVLGLAQVDASSDRIADQLEAYVRTRFDAAFVKILGHPDVSSPSVSDRSDGE